MLSVARVAIAGHRDGMVWRRGELCTLDALLGRPLLQLPGAVVIVLAGAVGVHAGAVLLQGGVGVVTPWVVAVIAGDLGEVVHTAVGTFGALPAGRSRKKK